MLHIFDRLQLALRHQLAQSRHAFAPARRIVEHDETLHPRPHHGQLHVGPDAFHIGEVFGVVGRDSPAQDNPCPERQVHQRCLEDLAADILEHHVHALRRKRLYGRGDVF